ncbi:MAG: amidohydrolase family protein [Sphingomonas sp.]|jgi:Tol biopolymer transport system component|uniref:amidohydrolase family protein n=1 Tax=Sphingomonas sp. TaxID=28214 RepID=UPI003567C70E
MRRLVAVAALAAVSAPALAADTRPRQPVGETLPIKPERQVSIETTNGTWMSLDVSPDGRTIVFDILGDLYVMPAAGGRARLISGGVGFDAQPAFSPDGRFIAFISDRSGAENLWVARADGSQPRQITFGNDDTALLSPAWSADGKAAFVSRFRPDLNNYELWRYGLDGSADLIAPIKLSATAPRSAWQSSVGAIASRDGKYLYYARRSGGIEFEDVKPWTIVRRDLGSSAETPLIAGSGARGADSEAFFRPILSPDDRLLAYATRRGVATQLRVRDLATGEDWLVAPAIDTDTLQASSWQDLSARYAFTPDGSAIVISHKGGFERIAVATGISTKLPFKASLRVDVAPSTRIRIREDNGPVRARLAMAPVASPDGRRIAFSALGAIYIQPADGAGPALRIGEGYQPSWSPDGSRIAFVRWSEGTGGAIWTAPADGRGPAGKVSSAPGYYSYPTFTPDGETIVAVRSAAAARQQSSFEFGKVRDGELVALPAGGGTSWVVATGRFGGRPHFASLPGKVFILTPEGLAAIDLASGARTRIAQVKGAGYYFVEGSVAVDDMRVSPDGKWLLAQVAQQLYLLPVPPAGAPEVDLLAEKTPGRRLTDVGADYFEWTKDGAITWSVGARFHRLALADALASAGIPKAGEGVALNVELPRDRPDGSLLLRGGRVLTMTDGDRILDNADILVTADRIVAIGPRGSLTVPPGTAVRDVTGKTILPGFVDVHDHFGSIRREVLATEDWGLRARLAYGVTTAFDPSTLSIDTLAYQDMADAGLILGPRLRSTGPAIFSMNRFASLDEVRAVLRRYRDAYGLHNIKEYRTGSRRVRQWMSIAARELGLLPTTEGALSLKLDLSQIQDGFAGNEHALPVTTLGGDAIGLLKAMRTSYTTTLVITNSAAPASDWFVARDDPQHDPRTAHFWPRWAIEQKLADRPWRPLDHYRFPVIAAGAAALQRAGGLVGMGAHGEVPGIGFHWEMEAHAMGGMAPMAVLHAATAGSAETIGRLDDIGTVEAGKLADLLILDRDPLADIADTRSIAQVMRGGRLYDSATLDEIWPVTRKLPPPWFASQPAEQWLPTQALTPGK